MTSVKLDEAMWKEARKKAIDEGIDFQDLVGDALKLWLKEHSKKRGASNY